MTCDWCRSAQVCRAWYVLALDGSNWQRVDLFQFQVDIEGAVVENLAKKCGGFLKSLSLNGCQVSEQICFSMSQTLNSNALKFCLCLSKIDGPM